MSFVSVIVCLAEVTRFETVFGCEIAKMGVVGIETCFEVAVARFELGVCVTFKAGLGVDFSFGFRVDLRIDLRVGCKKASSRLR